MKLLAIFLLLLLAACSNNEALQTLENNHAIAGTQVVELQVSATVLAARGQTTLEFNQTAAALAATQSQYLEATLIQEGVVPESIATERSRILGGDFVPQPNTTSEAPPTATLVINSASLPVATSPTAPSDNPQPRLENPQLATGTDANGCAIGSTTQFTTTTPEIYIVAVARDIPAYSILFEARWFRDNETIGPVYSFQPDYAIEQECIWFFVDPSDFAFEAGNYSVVIDMQGIAGFAPLGFTISDAGN